MERGLQTLALIMRCAAKARGSGGGRRAATSHGILTLKVQVKEVRRVPLHAAATTEGNFATNTITTTTTGGGGGGGSGGSAYTNETTVRRGTLCFCDLAGSELPKAVAEEGQRRATPNR